MLKKFGFILSLFIFCKSLDIISISNSGKKEIHFTKKKKYFVFEYKNSEGGNYSKVNIIKSQENNRSHYVYIYLNKSNIDEKFSNYYSKGNFDNSIYSIDINEPLKNKFYIVISQSNEIEQNNVTINIYSSDNFYETINSTVFYKNFGYTSSIRYYTFEFNHNLNGKYLKFGYSGYYQIYQTLEFYINENAKMIYSESKKLINEGIIETKSGNTYTINLKFSSTELDFYLVLTNHSYILPAQMDTKNYQIFPSLSSLNLSLDVNSINNNYKFKVEFHYKSIATISAFGYYTDDFNEIENTQGISLYLYHKNIVQSIYDKYFYILKDDPKLKTVILKITVPYPGSFEFKYGKQEPDSTDEKSDEEKKGKKKEEENYVKSIFISILFGLSLSLPNIIWQILRQILKKRTAPCICLFMNMLLHVIYGLPLSYFLNISGEVVLFAAFFPLGLYLMLLCYSCDCTPNSIFYQLYTSSKEFEELPILEEYIKSNREIPPKIIIKANSQHKESREILKEYEPYQEAVYRNDIYISHYGDISSVPRFDHNTINFEHVKNHYSEWKRVDEGGGKIEKKPENSFNSFVKEVEKKVVNTWEDEKEYKYISWQDKTKFLIKQKDISIINAKFNYKLIFNSSAEEGKKKVIDELCQEGKTHDTDVYYSEEYSCDGFIFNKKFYANKEEYNRIKGMHQKIYLFIGIILFILGYSSMIDCFFVYEEGEGSFIIEKLISDENDCRAEYMEKDENLPEIGFKIEEIKLDIEDEEEKLLKNDPYGKQISEPLLYK